MGHRFLIALVGGLALSLGCNLRTVRVGGACETDDQCIAGATCVDGVCRTGTPDAGACGDVNQPCCAPNSCLSGLFCINGTCIRPAATDVGKGCQAAADCSSGLCVDIGGGQSVCSAPCATQTECVPGWSCIFPSGGNGGVCQCTSASERCDNQDNDCNGVVDDGTGPNAQCEETTGPGSTCQSGTCVCPNRCGGVCVDPQTDIANCGTCGNACAAGATCTAGECACPAGQMVCEGVCLDTSVDDANCGTCGLACTGGTHCSGGECGCPETQLLCGDTCVDPQTDTVNCGDCEVLCPSGASCEAGQCACPDGQLACDGACISQNIGNCGGCNQACPLGHDSPACVDGQCVVRACDQGWADCNTSVTDGCEVDMRSDANNCGGCHNICAAGMLCQSGLCVCPPGLALCSGGCVDVTSDTQNCGMCGAGCPAGGSCVGGLCHCPDGELECNGRCINPANDPANCNGCGITCEPGASCTNGQCVCPEGSISCDGRCTPDQSDLSNCGGCHVICPVNHDTASCTAGVCGIAACSQGYENCNTSIEDGCETNLQADRNNCGSCGNVCAAATSCVSGQCKCSGTKTLCGSVCVDLTTDVANCSACGSACPSGAACASGQCRCATGSLVCNGACTPVQSDVNNCGACGNVCPAGASCLSGQCTCPAGKFACHGTCVASDLTNCGTCDNTCTAPNGTPACVNRTCTVSSCQSGFQDCDRVANNGCEVNTTSDVANCGGCNLACSGAHVSNSACAGSQCAGSCVQGYADCNRNLQTDGCEVDLNGDVNNCGGCGIKCGGPNVGAAACIGGVCTGMCVADYADCDLLGSDGCEVSLKTDANNCGGCGNVCSSQHMSSRTCGAGLCNGTCQTGYADCNANLLADGCEISTQTDPSNCGGCNLACSGSNVVNGACNAGRCGGTCATGYADCDGNLRTNGCERNIATDTANCGACNVACSGLHVDGSACSAGACTGTCSAGYADCDSNLQVDGCERNIATDTANCGGCNIRCSTSHLSISTCTSGTCTGTCATGYRDCNGNLQADGCEANIAGDVNNCGGCGTVCSGAFMSLSYCSSGSCTGSCTSGYMDCNGNLQADGCETHTATDVNNCGGCGNSCSGLNVNDPTCTGGTCTGTCATNFRDCNNNLRTDGCETNVTNDLANCGGCGQACQLLNVSNPACTSGACTGTCLAGYTDCDNNMRTNGCETQTDTSVTNCGGCGIKCSTTNVNGSACAAGVCTGTCKAGYTDCDHNLQANGCETNTTGDANNCGGCGLVCSSNHVSNRACSNGICGGTCFTGYADCNSNKQTDGCETNLFNDPDNCGSCGRLCPAGAHMARTCANPGTCGGTCDTGFADCDANLTTNGCEADLSSPDTCGACLHLCSGNHLATRTCSSGICGGQCTTGYADCNGDKGADGCEVSIFNNPSNCGACGIICSSNNVTAPSCSNAGVCNSTCLNGYADCNSNKQTDGCETSIFGNTNNCGGCGLVCSSNHMGTISCSSSGTCNGACSLGYSDCNNNKLSDGCEISTYTDTSNCGVCGRVCSTNHVDGSACTTGNCTGTCASGYKDCNSNLQSDGCEIYTDGDASNCGACGHVCPSSAPYCSSGSCYCPSGYLVCSGSCIAQSTSNCGTCGTVCSTNHVSGSTCNSGTCGGTCQSGWKDCNGNLQSDGCETDITTTSNCGACGNVCGSGQICSAGSCVTPIGQSAYTTPGTYSWTAPAGVTSVSVVVIGGGGGGAADRGAGGGGGALAWGNNIPVTPGQTYTVRVGAGGQGGWQNHTTQTGGPGDSESDTASWDLGQPGQKSYFISSSTLFAEGGGGASKYNQQANGGGTAVSGLQPGGTGTIDSAGSSTGGAGGGVGILGGSSGGTGGQCATDGCGGGAAGYTSAGGNATNGSSNVAGTGGSGGNSGTTGNGTYGGYGGAYGGGGAAGPGGTYTGEFATGAGGSGAGGAVRIIWGPNRSFPNTNTQDM